MRGERFAGRLATVANDRNREAPMGGEAVEAGNSPSLLWNDHEHRALSCRKCGLPRVFRRRKIRHSIHFMLALGSVGLWLPVWGVMIILGMVRPWTCTVCGGHQR